MKFLDTLRIYPRLITVREGGLEPPRPCGHWHLKPARLPFRHSRPNHSHRLAEVITVSVLVNQPPIANLSRDLASKRRGKKYVESGQR